MHTLVLPTRLLKLVVLPSSAWFPEDPSIISFYFMNDPVPKVATGSSAKNPGPPWKCKLPNQLRVCRGGGGSGQPLTKSWCFFDTICGKLLGRLG